MDRQRLLILGTGFGAFSLLRRIDARKYDVAIVSPRNHFVFTPLLPSTTVGTIEFRTIIEPIRTRSDVQFYLGKAIHLDLTQRKVRCESVLDNSTWDQSFDVLVIAVGCITNTFGIPGVKEHAHFLKEIEDARRIRQSLIANLERASLPGTAPEEQSRLLHIVTVGGGPTGVRFAGELYDLLHTDLPKSYPLLVGKIRVTIVDSGGSVLSAYDQTLRDYVQNEFIHRGVCLHSGTRVTSVTEGGIALSNGDFLPCGLVLWSAGFTRTSFVESLEVEKGNSGRILTDDRLQLLGHSKIFAVGDCACPEDQEFPQLAQVAEQQGRYLAESLNALAQNRPAEPFQWKPSGTSSFIGGGSAVSEAGLTHTAKLSGFWAYQQWRAATWTQLASLRSKILVPIDRFRAYLFGRDITRL